MRLKIMTLSLLLLGVQANAQTITYANTAEKAQTPFVVEGNNGQQATGTTATAYQAQPAQNGTGGQYNTTPQNQPGMAATNANVRVRETTETQKIDRQNNPVTKQIDYAQIGMVEKFVANNIDPEQIRQLRQQVVRTEDAIYQPVTPTKCVQRK